MFGWMSVWCFLVPAVAVHAGAMAPPPPFPVLLAQAEAILVGKVTAFENKTVMARRGPDDRERVEYRVAVVKVEESLIGGKGLTHVKVGVAPARTFRGSGGLPRSIPEASLKVGQEVLLLLRRHHTETFWVMPTDQDAVDSKAPDHRQKLEMARQAGKLMADPSAGLKAKDAGDRLLTATLLLSRYRKPRPDHRVEAIPADESRGILEALAGADWSKLDHSPGMVAPLALFYQLGVGEKDGWRQPADFQKVSAAAQKWLRDNAATHRIQGYVPAQTSKGHDIRA
jgi:hypothetical protein